MRLRGDPLLPQSVLRVTAFQRGGGSDFQVAWQSVADLNYRIESAPGPGGPWSFVRNVTSAGTGTTGTTVAGTQRQMFFRVVAP